MKAGVFHDGQTSSEVKLLSYHLQSIEVQLLFNCYFYFVPRFKCGSNWELHYLKAVLASWGFKEVVVSMSFKSYLALDSRSPRQTTCDLGGFSSNKSHK